MRKPKKKDKKPKKKDLARPSIFFERRRDVGFLVQQKVHEGVTSAEGLPVPGKQFLKYAQDEQRYLSTGKRDAQILTEAVVRGGLDPERPGNVLEFGCANGRVLRWLFDWAQAGEVWGVDIESDMVFWCHENLSPPFHFAVNTTAPHLFFEDHFFSLVYCYSIFTHLDDLYLSWICELRRVIRPGGILFVTIRDEHSAAVQRQRFQTPEVLLPFESPTLAAEEKVDGDLFAAANEFTTFAAYKRDYARRLFSHAFEELEVIEETMGRIQTALVLRRK